MNARAAWRLWPVIVVLSLGMQDPDPVRVGLLIPSGEVGLAARRGAELAVQAANREGGFRGRPFELVVRSVEGLWGSGSSEITSLVFRDSVWAILGPLHGRSAHLAEQVAAKGHVALVSPWASDPTLTQANVPWFFRLVPDDREQSRALAREIFGDRRLGRVVAVVADSYDARVAADAFVAAADAFVASADVSTVADASATTTGSIEVSRWALPDTGEGLDTLLQRLGEERIEGIALFGAAPTSEPLVGKLRARGFGQPIFSPLPGADMFRQGPEPRGGGLLVVAPGHWATAEGQAFERAYGTAYGQRPAAVAAYAYDGSMVIVEAVRRAGLDRGRIRDALADIDYERGITGRVRFDERGNRRSAPELLEIVRPRVEDGTGQPEPGHPGSDSPSPTRPLR